MTVKAVEVEPPAAPTGAAEIEPAAEPCIPWDVLDTASVGESAFAECPTVNNLRFELESHDEPTAAAGPQPAAEPCLRWDVPDNADRLGIDHYVVKLVDENHGKQRGEKELAVHVVPLPAGGLRRAHLYIEDATLGSVCRADVTAVSKADMSPGPSQSVRFLLEETLRPSSAEAEEHWGACAAALQPYVEAFYNVRGRGPTFLVLGKQHHGKSSIVNHFNRWLRQCMRTPDLTRVAPPGDLETTTRTEKFKIPVCSLQERFVEFVDVPAFATMDDKTRRDLQSLLWSKMDGWARGQRSWWPIANAPDGVIIVVSLLSWRDEHSALKEYLAVFTEELQRRQRRFPYVVYATHKDKFWLEEGNKGEDPRCRLREAVEDLRRLANTDQVFAVTSYRRESWWTRAVDEAALTSLQQLISDAKVRASKTPSRLFLSWGKFLLVLVVGLLAVVWHQVTKANELEQSFAHQLGEEQAKTHDLEQKLGQEQTNARSLHARAQDLEHTLEMEQTKARNLQKEIDKKKKKLYSARTDESLQRKK